MLTQPSTPRASERAPSTIRVTRSTRFLAMASLGILSALPGCGACGFGVGMGFHSSHEFCPPTPPPCATSRCAPSHGMMDGLAPVVSGHPPLSQMMGGAGISDEVPLIQESERPGPWPGQPSVEVAPVPRQWGESDIPGPAMEGTPSLDAPATIEL